MVGLRHIAEREEIAYEYGDFGQGSLEVGHSWIGKPGLKAVSKVWKNKSS